ncbi:TPA: hypothetical protein ACFBYZ_000863 [Neisseria gonorrhoeae]
MPSESLFFGFGRHFIADFFLEFDRMFARFVEHDVRPTFLRQSQIHAVGMPDNGIRCALILTGCV